MNNKNYKLMFVAFGSLGDVYPLISIAKEMKGSHPICFLANEYFKERIESAGIEFVELGTREEQLAALESKESSGESTEGRTSRFENLIGVNFKRAYDILMDYKNKNIDMVVVTHGNLSPVVPFCEKYKVPVVLTHYAPSQIPNNVEDKMLMAEFMGYNLWFTRNVVFPFYILKSKFSFDVKDKYNEYRKGFGLPTLKSGWQLMIDKLLFRPAPKNNLFVPLEIALLPKWFCEPVGVALEHIQFSNFPFYDEKNERYQLAIDNFVAEHGKPIVFTPGTAVEDVAEFCEKIIPICRKLGSPGVFASKHGKEAFDRLEKVDDVPLLYLDHADFSYLLPKSRCLIHHGGVGTIAQAVRAGIPQIIRPRMYDQPANSVRVMLYGLGGAVDPNAYDEDTVAQILLHLESYPKNIELLDYYSQEVNKENGVLTCVKYIENYLIHKFAFDVPALPNVVIN